MAQEFRQLKAIEVVLKKGDESRSRAVNEGQQLMCCRARLPLWQSPGVKWGLTGAPKSASSSGGPSTSATTHRAALQSSAAPLRLQVTCPTWHRTSCCVHPQYSKGVSKWRAPPPISWRLLSLERLLQDPRGLLSPTQELEAKRSPTLLGLHSKGPGQTAQADFLLSENVKNHPGSCAALEGGAQGDSWISILGDLQSTTGQAHKPPDAARYLWCSEYTKAASPQRSPPAPVSQSLPAPAQAYHQFTLIGKTCSISHSPSLSTDKILINNWNYLNISQKDEVPNPSEFLMQKPQQVCSQARAHPEQNHQPMNTTSSTTDVINHFFHYQNINSIWRS